MEEKVVVIDPIENNFDLRFEDGIIDDQKDIRFFFNVIARTYDLLERSAADATFAKRQLVVYPVVVNNGNILRYQRYKGGEKRLENKWSVGFGGHVNEDDSRYWNMIDKALEREMYEELMWIPRMDQYYPVSLIQSDLTDVDKMHIGVVYIVNLTDPQVAQLVAREGISNLTWVKPQDTSWISKAETWTKIVMENVFEREWI